MKFRGSATFSALFLALATAIARPAEARGPYVVLRDDGTFAAPLTTPSAARSKIVPLYARSGAPIPDIISVWTSFPMGGGPWSTYYVPVANDVRGIGLEKHYGGDGTIPFVVPPLRTVLLHNDVTQLARRAALQQAPLEGFAEYLFLLELSHVWGPSLSIPATRRGATGSELIGFDYHWSFFLDPGGPAGGNRWVDNQNGTFSVLGARATSVKFSMLDLYVMGLAEADEVPPFGLLENVVVPTNIPDPFTGRPYAARSFPWFRDTAFTVTATRRTITIEDVVAANGPRIPAASDSPKAFDLGIALLVPADATDDDIAAAEALFDPVARKLAPAFREATSGRGTLNLVTPATEPTQGERNGEASSGLGSGAPADVGIDSTERGGEGCAIRHAGHRATPRLGCLALLAAAAGGLARRRAARNRRTVGACTRSQKARTA